MPNPQHRPVAAAVGFGIASVALYALLFIYADLFPDWARRTRDGEHALALIPVAVAFAFSWVHGAFAGYFWDVLGLRAAAGSEKTKKLPQRAPGK